MVFCISELFAIKLSLNFALRRPSLLHPPRATDLEENIPEKPSPSFPSYLGTEATAPCRAAVLKVLIALGKRCMCPSACARSFKETAGNTRTEKVHKKCKFYRAMLFLLLFRKKLAEKEKFR